MTDDVTGMPPNEEPTQSAAEPQLPAVDEMPTVTVTPPTLEEVTQTASTEVTLQDEMATVTITPDVADEATQAMPADALPPVAPTVQAAPQATPAPAYEQFGEMTEAVQPGLYPGMASVTPAGVQPQVGDPAAFYAQEQYAQYPAQPGIPFPGAPVPVKKRRTLLWVAIAIIVVLLVGGGTAFAIVMSQRPTNTPTQTLQQYCHGFVTLNAQEVYDSLSSASKSATSVSEIQQGLDLLRNMSDLVKLSNCTVSNVQQNGSTATGTITLTETVSLFGSTTSMPFTLSMAMVLENNTWKINTAGTTMPNFQMPTMPAFPTPTVSS